jgi:predicted amidohydrolase
MPFLAQMVFYLAGVVFLLVGSFRSFTSRRAWKADARGGPSHRYKMPASLQLEIRLYNLGLCICWGVSFPYWWMRALFAGLGLVTILILLYRNDLKAPDAPPYDARSTLRLTRT